MVVVVQLEQQHWLLLLQEQLSVVWWPQVQASHLLVDLVDR